MKKLILFLLLLTTISKIQAEHHFVFSGEIACESERFFSAEDHILMLPGCKVEPKNDGSAGFFINPYLVTPTGYGINGGPETNDDGVVGALKGDIDVSVLGAATYTVPIEMPEGLGAMRPSVFIYYNNQQRNGLLGWNWDLGGVSAITRTGATLYHDGFQSAVDYTNDRFCLDGQRLLKVSGNTYGGQNTVYHTEIDQMSKIVSYTESGIQGPSYFKVWTADGKICYYGTSEDSKALKDTLNHINVWLLKSIEDRYGNVIHYYYNNLPDSYRLTKIEYSGNNKEHIDPSLSISFAYLEREDVETAAHGNCMKKTNVLLKKIHVKNKTALMYTYTFNYQNPNPEHGYPYNLLTSIEFSAGNQHLNPTKIKWGDNNYELHLIQETSIPVTTLPNSSAFANAVKFSGDFNGDGHTDVIAVRPNPDGTFSSHAEIFLNKGVDGDLVFNRVKTIELDSAVNWIYTADFNGDGWDDILISERIRIPHYYPDIITSTVYISGTNPSGNMTFTDHQIPHWEIRNDLWESLVIGDFYGEGRQSILIQALTEDDKSREQSMLIRYNNTYHEFQTTLFDEQLNAMRFIPGDFDGDGATEILYKNQNGVTTIAKLRNENGEPHYVTKYQGRPVGWEDCFTGDFNGDGVTDVLFYKKETDNYNWFITIGNNAGIGSENIYLPLSFPYSSPGNYHFSLDIPHETNHFINVGDFDGNGCSDLILKDSDGNVHVYYGPIRRTGGAAPFTNHRLLNSQVFQYFSNMDLCVGNFLGHERLTFLGNYTLSHLPSMNISHEVQQITDGMGRKIQLQYDYLTANPKNPSTTDFYYLHTPFASLANHVCITPIPLRALKAITTYNVKNKPMVTECHYEGALLHKQGKGFLGFSITRQKDYCNNQLQKTTTRHFEFNPEGEIIQLPMTSEEVHDKHGNLVAGTTYATLVYTNLNNSKIYVPVSNKTIEEYDVDHPERLVKKEITEITVNTHCDQLFQYDNLLSVTETTKGVTDNPNITLASSCPFQEKKTTNYMPDIVGQWLINRPNSITTTAHREGNYADICHQEIYQYNGNKPYQVNQITSLPNNGSHPDDRLTTITSLQYDLTGNIVSKTISAPYDSVSSRTEQYEYSMTYGRRFLTKKTDAAGHQTRFTYDAVYGYCTSMIDCNLLETQYNQDPFGVTKLTTYPDGTKTSQATRWNYNGYSVNEKKTGLPTKIVNYAFTGDLLSKTSYTINGESVIAKIVYDDWGRIQKEEPPCQEGQYPQSLTYEYDSHNRIQNIFHNDGSREVLQYDGKQTSTSFYSVDNTTQSESKTVNAMGWVVKSTDASGNNIIYDHYPDGKVKWAQIEGIEETRITICYDGNGNRSLLFDPNYGLTSSEHNAFNEMTRQVSPALDITEYEYDNLGNMTRRTETCIKSHLASTTEWIYGQEEGLYNVLQRIKSENQIVDYDYDEYLRVSGIHDHCLGKEYVTSYTYDQASRIASVTYPSNYTLQYHYTSEGLVRDITDVHSKVLWRTEATHPFGHPLRFSTGNGLVSNYEYDENKKLKRIQTKRGNSVLQDYQYEYNSFSNITSRSDLVKQRDEQFSYDPLNRLIGVVDDRGVSEFCYDDLGRMTSKTKSGESIFSEAVYGESLPHAIKSAVSTPGVFPQERMDLEYTPLGKVSRIQEGSNHVSYEYGYDHQRIHLEEEINGQTREKIYVNNCEFITQKDELTVRTFLSGPLGIFAVAETIGNRTSLHYIHKDHLGSWTMITDSTGKVEQENWFDAWGNNEHDQTLLFDRGFTGHEHINGMNLINMDGRLYDPVTSSMLSPDNYIQTPDFSQNFNRYSYCLNNPLVYTDPDGNSYLETALLIYFVFFTDIGYEYQKTMSWIAIHADIHIASHQKGVGLDVSIGVPKKYDLSYRFNLGTTYYFGYYDNSYKGWEFRVGSEWTVCNLLGYAGTTFYTKGRQQTTNSIIIGNYIASITYENDYMFDIDMNLFGVPPADNGDRYRTAAGKIRFGPLSVGFNIFTGDPGLERSSRRTFNDPDANGRLTYTLNEEGCDPDQYRAGIVYFSIFNFSVARNSEQVRHFIQNRVAHDFLCRGDSPYFKVLDRPAQTYFYFSTSTGGTLW